MTQHPQRPPFAGRRVLIVEDDFFLADELRTALAAQGAEVVGPVANIDDALDLIEQMQPIHAAVLDLNLQGEMAFPVADALNGCGVPFVLATGYDLSAIPVRYASVPRCEKPVNLAKVKRMLFG
jgi:ActR/RegA family two-component response regulator